MKQILKKTIAVFFCVALSLFINNVTNAQAFKHPGVLNSQAELDFVKAKIQANQQPWLQAFNTLKSSSYSSLTYKDKPYVTVSCGSYNNPNIGCSQIVDDGMAAYSLALMWSYTGDVRYATKSIAIINGWSTTFKNITTESNQRLVVSWAAPWYVNAAEILRYSNSGWTNTNSTNLNGFLSKMLPYIKDDNMPGNNWVQSAIEAQFAIAIFTDNRTEFNNAVARWKTRVKTYIYQKSDGATPLNYPTGNLPVNSSKWNGTKTFIDGLCMETCRDLGHMKLGINSMMYAAQSAYEQGVDLFTLEQKRLSDFFELHGSWMTGAKAVPSNINGGLVIVSPNTPGIKPPNGGGQTAFEIGYNHLHTRLNKNMPYTLQMINHTRPSSAGHWVFKWETLTHGNLPFNLNTTTPPNTAPTISITSPQSNGSIDAPATITINATATDDKKVTKVEFYNGSNLLNTYTSAPYNFTWTNVGIGNYTITAKAYDADNASKVSNAITISVKAKQAADYTPPNGYAVVANENENISLTDKVNIAYGVNGTFVYLYNQTSSVGCSNVAFGTDPAIGIAKKCYIQKVQTTPIVDYTPPAGYTLAANEWDNVIVTGKMNIAFGANGTFTYLYNQSSNVMCTNTAFGKDPVTGISKKCFVQAVSTPPPPTDPTANGVNGPACVEVGKSYTYSVKPDNYIFKSANWWSNSSAEVQINSNSSSMSIMFPANTNGSTITVSAGVNINVAPWYKEYTMNVKVGGCTGSTPQLRASATPQPFNASTTVSLENNEMIKSVVVVNMNGIEVYRASNIELSEFELGEDLPVGMYIAHIESTKGLSIIKLVKTN